MSNPCPTCKKPSVVAFTPFCSKRCADVDLNRWFTESYAIPAVEMDDGDEEDVATAQREADEDKHH